MSLGSCNKVDTSTQVDYNFIEVRRIIGQEDDAVENLSKDLSGLNLRRQNKGIRPPLVGQASSSSNDSVSIPFKTKSSANTQVNSMSSPTQTIEQNEENDSINNYKRQSFLINRNDYINQKPPEGSYSQIYSLPVSQTSDSNQDFARVRSSSSASSVTSNKRLEWDNGADVGYNQSHVDGNILDPNMSTVERIALVSSTKLLRRSDPEGTTGGLNQQMNNLAQTKIRLRQKFGNPNAESTPLGTNVVSDTSPETGDFISPIPYEKKEDSDSEIQLSESEALGEIIHKPRCLPDHNTEHKLSPSYINEATKLKVPLFPEMGLDSFTNDIENLESGCRVLDENSFTNAQSNGAGRPRQNSVDLQSVIDRPNDEIHMKIQHLNDELKTKLGAVDSLDMVHKKLSSSLENISNTNIASPSINKNIPNTLPRSQSQTDLYHKIDSLENIKNVTGSKGNIGIQHLFKYNSASSSSVATVVNRKGDSPKHALVQTSILKKQSVGVQVCDSIERNTTKTKVLPRSVFSDAPHLPKAILTLQLIKKSNYFDLNPNDGTIKSKNASTDLTLEGHNDSNVIEKEFISNNFGSHFHNGVLCKGAHRKNILNCESTSHSHQVNPNFLNSNNCGIDRPSSTYVTTGNPFTSKNQHQRSVSTVSFDPRKNNSGSMVDSVESSTKSGGCGTDQHYSVTVEDRVNSFEYLPGHVYENNERQHPINSCGTSSMSIEHQSSNNASPEVQVKMWESSGGGSLTSTFDKDAQRGVDILSDFVKDAYNNNTLLKRKLIKRVINKLISKNDPDKNVEPRTELLENRPWVPPRPSNPIERNAIKISKSKVPCEFSSHSEKSLATNTSSECFIPKPANRHRPKCVSSFFHDGSCQKYQDEQSSTSNITPENSAEPLKNSPKSPKFSNKQKPRKNQTTNPSGNIQSKRVLRTSNWKAPATETEKLIEERRKFENESCGSQSSVTQLLDMERENQLFWIRSEIEHLSNLKLLLERQEELKQGLKNCKSRRSRSSEKNILKEKNMVEKDKSKISVQNDAGSKKHSLKTTSLPKLNEWLNDAVSKSHRDLDGWTSHHYENDEKIKSCLKRKGKYQTQHGQTRNTTVDKDYVLYDEPPNSPQKRKQLNTMNDKPNEYPPINKNGKNRRSETNMVGPGSRSEDQAEEPEPGCQCECQVKCKCCTKRSNTNADSRKKEPLGYYIIFDNPKANNRVDGIRTSGTVGEQKKKPARQIKVDCQGVMDTKVSKKAVLKEGTNMRRVSESGSTEMEPTSDENESFNSELDSKKPIYKGGAGDLQYNLLLNRPSYVSRAEDRRQCIAQMQYLRELSSQNKERLLALTQPNPPPPPPTKVRRVFSQHQMRQMTEKKYRKLSEVKERVQDMKKKESYRTNRLMAEIFKKNLQKRVLKGEVNLSNSVFVISSV